VSLQTVYLLCSYVTAACPMQLFFSMNIVALISLLSTDCSQLLLVNEAMILLTVRHAQCFTASF